MTHAPPIFAQACIVIAIGLACLIGAGKPGTSESNAVFVFVGTVVCLLGAIAIAGETVK